MHHILIQAALRLNTRNEEKTMIVLIDFKKASNEVTDDTSIEKIPCRGKRFFSHVTEILPKLSASQSW